MNNTEGAGTIRVMLVDDHSTLLWGLERLIDAETPRMCVVGAARAADEAVAKAAALVPDVIVLDLDLAGQDAAEFLPAMLDNGVSRALVLTGERRHGVLDAAVRAGARGVLGKEASAEVLLKAIEKTHAGELWLDREMMARVFSSLTAPHQGDPLVQRHASLTGRERVVIDAVVAYSDCLNKTIAQRLCMSDHTLRNHLTTIYHKLDVKTRLELYVYATRHKLARPIAEHAHH
ncbi:response regulator transcription factor [Massilia solisilvae]|uniref:Response regulator transcription factor n=1 Tax=Massilia solisilvae TaxID=1811225 RepID=A0ABT2BLU6_9BURK|nr:response regulator transcription factor [Massilia solisilvae]MCS0609490.1 response regulator transcription factor [Massilia solisilvae]